MTKVHPNGKQMPTNDVPKMVVGIPGVVVLTVWTKSLVLNSKGFTVFDCDGNLVFRVNGYATDDKGEVVFMDAIGSPLFTARCKRKKLSLGEIWLLFKGESMTNPILKAKKKQSNSKSSLLQVSSYSEDAAFTDPSSISTLTGRNKKVKYEIEGSYPQRSCTMYDENRKMVVEIASNAGLGTDAFRLMVLPRMDQAIAMALVILLDSIFGWSSKLF